MDENIVAQLNFNTYLLSFVGVLISIVAYFLIRTLRQIDMNQTNLADRMRKIEQEFMILLTEHKILCAKNLSKPKE